MIKQNTVLETDTVLDWRNTSQLIDSSNCNRLKTFLSVWLSFFKSSLMAKKIGTSRYLCSEHNPLLICQSNVCSPIIKSQAVYWSSLSVKRTKETQFSRVFTSSYSIWLPEPKTEEPRLTKVFVLNNVFDQQHPRLKERVQRFAPRSLFIYKVGGRMTCWWL